MEETISLKEIFEILRKHLSTILISMFVGLGLAGFVTFFVMTPQYSSRAQLIVAQTQNENSANNLNDVNYNLQMLNTYKDIIKEGDSLATTVSERLSSEFDINMSPSEIKNHLEVEQSQNSQMFSIVATSDQAINSEHIANTAAEVFQETVKDVLVNVDKITILSKATAKSRPDSPNNKLNLAIGLVLGLIVGVGLAFIMELFDRTVKDSKFVTDELEMTVLGSVPQMTAKEVKDTTLRSPRKMEPSSGDDHKNTITNQSRRNRSRV